jgi:hypothetical protein
MTYDEALKRAEKVGARKAGRQEFLAMICQSLASIHAINPRLVYAGATKLDLDAKQVATLAINDPVGLGDLMFA